MEEYSDVIKKTIKKELKKIGYTYDEVPTLQQEYLLKIEKHISERVLLTNQLSQDLKKQKFSSKSVAKNIGCSRTTLYNYNVIKEYVALRIKEYTDINLFSIIDSLKQENMTLNNTIDNFLIKDIQYEELKKEKDNYKDRYNLAQKAYEQEAQAKNEKIIQLREKDREILKLKKELEKVYQMN